MTMMKSKAVLRLYVAAAASVAMIGAICARAAQTPAPTQSPSSAQSRAAGTENGSYFPLALGNWWAYTVKKPSQPYTPTAVMWRVARKEKEASYGPQAYQLSATPVQGDEPTILALRENGIVDPDTGNVLLKNPLATGDRWSDKPSFSPNTYEVVSAGQPCEAGGHRFRDCAVVREVNEKGSLMTLRTYARGVGPVVFVYYKDLDVNKIDSTVTIQSWHVK
jgi:hypothetical protein